MKSALVKLIRFLWRVARNTLSFFPMSRQFLFPPLSLAERFGRHDAEYAWQVFHHHRAQLSSAGFTGAERILEVGPGRNLGTALLFWCQMAAQSPNAPLQVTCWDVFRNIEVVDDSFWSDLANELLMATQSKGPSRGADSAILEQLDRVANSRTRPDIRYRVESINRLEETLDSSFCGFDLIYSHAAIEHVWAIDEFWSSLGRLTATRGWHSHRIDLADHGRRETNYIEMLEWSRWAYWMTMRFVPGATNRWRARDHLEKLLGLGFEIVVQRATLKDRLPIPLGSVSAEFRALGIDELRTVAIDVVAKMKPPKASVSFVAID